MQIDRTDAAVKSLAIAGAIGITVAAPFAGLYVLPFLSPFLIDIGKAGLETVKGVGSNALWDMRSSFKPARENEDLTRLLGEAYSAAIEDVLKQNAGHDLIHLILPSIKQEIDGHLATGSEDDLLKLFPKEENLLAIEADGQKKLPFYKRLLGKEPIEYRSVDGELLANITAEDFILKLSDDRETAKRVIAEEVEITLRRWFVQLNPTLAKEYTFPPSLDKTVFERIGELIPQKINKLVKRDDLNLSWIAFQRSHLQAILKQVNNPDNGLSADDRKTLRRLGEFLDKLSETDELLEKLAAGAEEILARVGESEENIKNRIAEERAKLQRWLEPKIDDLLEIGKDTNEISKDTNKEVKEVKEIVSKFALPLPQDESPNFVALPKLGDRVYGRKKEIGELLAFLESDRQHGAIYAVTCIGKTSLLRKFLHKNLNAERTASESPELFEKVIYLDCQEYQNFQGIFRHFATLLQKTFDYKTGEETDVLKHEIFPELQNERILMIFDNFESWINEEGSFINSEVAVFLECFRHFEHRIRGLFVGWYPPAAERNFNAAVPALTDIGDDLLEGMDKASALALVRDEGEALSRECNELDLHTVDEAKLIGFFEKVYYVPQAIQSMIRLVADENIPFEQFLAEYLPELEERLKDKTQTGVKRLEKLRPARALLEIQIGRLSDAAEYILSHLAFYDLKVPKEILLLDLVDKAAETFNRESKPLRQAFNLLDKSRLVKTEIETQDAPNPNAGTTRTVYCRLHGFIRETVRDCLPKFEIKYETRLENLADQMIYKTNDAWQHKLFYKQLALAECWEKLEDHLIKDGGKSFRQLLRDGADFNKAMASQEIAELLSVNLTDYQRKQLRATSERLYLVFIEKNPNNAVAYNNLGLLLAKDEDRRAEAETAYRKAIELNSNDAAVYNNLGNLLAEDKKRQSEAEANYNKAIELNPSNAIAYYNLGILFAEDEKRQRKAETTFRKAIELNLNYAVAYYNLGVLLARDEDRRAEAEEAYRKAIELNPDVAGADYNLACLRALSGKESDKEECFSYLKKAIALDSRFKELAKSDPDFDFVRDDPRFKELVGD